MKRNLAVFFGGPSVEHDVSIITAVQTIKNADPDKYTIWPVYWQKDGTYMTAPHPGGQINFDRFHQTAIKAIPAHRSLQLCKSGLLGPNYTDQPIDLALPCFHGTLGEDGAFQGLLEVMDIPYCGSNVTASAIGMDKVIFKAVMRANDIPVLDNTTVKKSETPPLIKFPYPVIVKPAHLGSSIGVKKASDLKEVNQALEVIFELDTIALIEPYLTNMIEVNCSVLGSSIECQVSITEQPLSSKEILSFADKYLKGGKNKDGVKGMASLDRRIPAPIERKDELRIQKYAEKVFSVCGCAGVARVDFMIAHGQSTTGKDVPNGHMLSESEIYVTEINTIPGSLSFYLWEASGVSYRELIDRLVAIAETEYQLKKSLLRTYDSPILKKLD